MLALMEEYGVWILLNKFGLEKELTDNGKELKASWSKFQ